MTLIIDKVIYLMEYLIKIQTTSTVLHADEEMTSNPILLCSVQCDNIIVISHLVYFMQLHIHTSTQSCAHCEAVAVFEVCPLK